ncbi:TPA: hypothetical protein SBX51_001272 [Campylobacter coli]|nr:hypothetical protein [Campylobacter coli]HBK1875211.1 hypothetical protein [Campylobacter coli]HEF9352501.1 hypothetical protein [Campylobacter coli]HEF9448577.1 hypothetical protein [Campylobacter coli]
MFSFILEKFFGVSSIIIVLLLSVCGFLYYENHSLVLENNQLKLTKEYLKNEIKTNKEQLLKQNKAFENLKLELKPKETLKEVSKVKEIFIKDKSCESELKVYKELFKILGAKQ